MEIQKIMSKYHISKHRIDLAGPDGNVFVLIGLGGKWLNALEAPEKEIKEFREDMRKSDYKHALEVFKSWFGDDVVYNSNDEWGD